MLQRFVSRVFPDTDISSDLNPFLTESEDSGPSEQKSSSPEIDDDFVFKIDKVTGENPYSIDTSNKTVTIDPERGDWEAGKEDLKEAWVENSRVFFGSAFELYLSIQANKGRVNEVCEFFEPILTVSQHAMLEQAYHTSIYFNNFDVPKNEKDRRREQLAERYESKAMNVPSLCSAGYFEEDGLFRDIYRQLPDDGSKDGDYQELFDKLVRKRPFVIFVRNSYTVDEVYDLLIQKSRHLDRLDVDIGYIHIRGIGKYSREKIGEVLKILDQNHPDIKYMKDVHQKESGSTELVVAIDNDSI